MFNIGGEGQLIMGAVGASAAGLALGDGPHGADDRGMVAAGAAGGRRWAGIAGALRAWAGANEIITTLMLNYIAANLAEYLIFGSQSYWRKLDGTGLMFPQGKTLALEAPTGRRSMSGRSRSPWGSAARRRPSPSGCA